MLYRFAVIVLAGLAVLAVACSDREDAEPERGCTLIGCDSGVRVELTDWLSRHPRIDPGRIEVCVGDVCDSPGDRQTAVRLPFAHDPAAGDPLEVTVHTTEGDVVGAGTFVVEPGDASQPNGPDCPPICWNIGLELTSSGEVRRATS